jgi:NTP pyrophosphatase (non-canonical NTP hydrolase)
MNLNILKSKIEEWFIARNLHTANPDKQMLKLGEEYGELCAGMVRNKEDVVIDSIGDMFVVMVGLCLQLDIDLESCIEAAYDQIKDRKGKMIDGVFIKEEDLQQS